MSITLPSFLFVFFSMFRKLLQRNLYSRDTLGINANVPPKHVCVGGYLKRGWIGVCSYLSFFFIYHTHDDFDIADPSSTQDACHRWTARLESFVAQWLEHPTGVRELIGSIPVGDSEFFLGPVLVTCSSHYVSTKAIFSFFYSASESAAVIKRSYIM